MPLSNAHLLVRNRLVRCTSGVSDSGHCACASERRLRSAPELALLPLATQTPPPSSAAQAVLVTGCTWKAPAPEVTSWPSRLSPGPVVELPQALVALRAARLGSPSERVPVRPQRRPAVRAQPEP